MCRFTAGVNRIGPGCVFLDMRTQRIRLATLGIVACIPFALAGCGSDEPAASDAGGAASSSSSPDTSASEGATGGETSAATITIKDFAYGDPLTVAPSTEVTVINEDSAPHNANDAGGAWAFDLLQQGESTTFTAPAEPGTYDLICTQHSQMSGELNVEG